MRIKVFASALLFLMPILANDNDGEMTDPAADEVASSESAPGDDHAPPPPSENRSVSSEGDNAAKGSTSFSDWVKFSGNMGLVSDYVYRGQTQTFGGPALQGQLVLSDKRGEGLYAGLGGSNVSSTIAPNGAGLELDLFGGYSYKYNPDLTLKLELKNTRYPGAVASLPTKDKYDVLELIPAVTYRIVTVSLACALTNRRGVNQNFASTFPVPLKANGNSVGSWYAEANMVLPLPQTNDRLKFNLLGGYWYAKNYTALNYGVVGAGVSYKLPEDWTGLVLSLNGSATSANKKYYKLSNMAGGTKNTVGPKVWVGLKKEF